MLHILSGTVQQQLHIGRTTLPEMQQAKSTDCRVLSLSDRRYSLNPLSQTRID